ncbi:vitrin isoform X1 [Crotalus tigris]|uniref:vitrin isoform X1 n=1 Tax=Crotalus tigris TaxID=88082 RepID=UPI00192F5768|nr:vitrin isoform X1 [Crotalus tigris]XP_039208235.1 vitrin isoform X1 [Crotalus tigris]XP_039208236.1 vitrin isoform X1 [Crotalus tigris]
MKRITAIALVFVLLLTCIYATKETTKRNRKSKQSVPQIECAIKAAKIINPEFIAKCPLGCQDVKYRVYGTDIYASFSSVCAAAIHSGIIDNSGGKVLVQKVAGQSGYKGSFSNGIRSLSLPRWRESFILSEGKPKRGVQYPSILTYSSSESTVTKGNSLRKGSLTTTAPLPATHGAAHTFKRFTITTELVSTTPKATTTSATIAPMTFTKVTTVTVAKPLVAVHKVRDLGSSNVHPVYSAVAAAAASRQVQTVQGRTQNQATETDVWKFGSSLLDSGFSSKEDIVPKPLKPVSQGNPNCKVDLAFLIDGSWSIGRRRFQIQKQFLKDVSQALDVGPIGPLMGIVQYGDDPSTEFNLKAYANTKDLKNAIEKISQKGGLSNVGKALSFVNKNYFEDANGNRGGAPNVAVVLVDGWPTDKVEEASRLARESGINIFFVTIEGPDENEKKNVVETNFVDKAVCRTNGYYSIHVTSWFTLYKVVQPLVKRVCDVDRLACSKTCLNAADIGFVIDGSSSVGTGNFRTILQFVANISKEFEISDTDTRIGAVQYTYEQRLEFDFNKHNTKQEVLNAIKRINYWSGGTSTGAAINFAFEQLFSKSKPNKRKIMILITDGRSYDDVRGPALAAHQNGVIAYSIGIAWAAQDELEAVATDPDKEHSFFVDEFDRLYRFVPKIIQNICTEFNSQPRN